MGDALARYYDSRDPLGAKGDFITAPEISQLFGEIIGVWTARKWLDMGSPAKFNLIELGPGRGTLMADLLRATRHIPGFHSAASIYLVETSRTLIEKQQTTLNGYNVQWCDHLKDISSAEPAIIIANEFFDALPVRQFRLANNSWQECYIDENTVKWIDVDTPPLKSTLPHPAVNDIYEYSDAQKEYANIIHKFQGAALIIDYGYFKSAYGDTLQALHHHNPCKIIDHIGNADITSHVDFEWLSTFFSKYRLSTQSQFLMDNGIAIRYRQLHNDLLRSGYERLIHSRQMGELFKVLEISI